MKKRWLDNFACSASVFLGLKNFFHCFGLRNFVIASAAKQSIKPPGTELQSLFIFSQPKNVQVVAVNCNLTADV